MKMAISPTTLESRKFAPPIIKKAAGVVTYDAVIVGGGFYGLRIALFLNEELNVHNILVIEKEQSMMSRASYVNQARVHSGYHYPRSILTGYRSAVNFPRFVGEYNPAIVKDFDKYYAIAQKLSKVNAKQFKAFCDKIDVEARPAPESVARYFNPYLVEKVFAVREYAFNSHKLRDLLLERIEARPGIVIHGNEEVKTVAKTRNGISVQTSKDTYQAAKVFNCAYSQINALHRRSSLPLVGMKHEITELCLVELPKELKNFSVTVMDGPFFSIMPFPSLGLHSLSHVRYTPHTSWSDDASTPEAKFDTHNFYKKYELVSNYRKMAADVVRYIPALKNMQYKGSISEVKTVLVKSEGDDSRPILFKPHLGIHGYTCIMGGKLDNIYDVFSELGVLYGQE
jgi:glycine/D-amino acid oxidase-like deaminating enzyme